MMIPPTQEELDLLEKLRSGVSEEERKEIDKRLFEIYEEQNEKYNNYPFAH